MNKLVPVTGLLWALQKFLVYNYDYVYMYVCISMGSNRWVYYIYVCMNAYFQLFCVYACRVCMPDIIIFVGKYTCIHRPIIILIDYAFFSFTKLFLISK